MLKGILMASVAGLLISAAPVSQIKLAVPANSVRGDYVEARTASVFAGACHYNGEYMSTGNDAVAAWHFTSGRWNGVDISGVRAIAAVTSDSNLADNLPRKSELTIDSAATPAQREAVVSLIRQRYAAALGAISAVHVAPVEFRHDGSQYVVDAPGFATMTVEYMPNDECCKQPNLVWYTPLIDLTGRKVGFVDSAGYLAGNIADAWQRFGENSAFYGAFSF
jgi:hypothetical protein